MSPSTVLPAVASIALKATLVLMVAALIERTLLRRATAAARHQLWAITLVTLMALPPFVFVVPRWRIPIQERLGPGTLSELSSHTEREPPSIARTQAAVVSARASDLAEASPVGSSRGNETHDTRVATAPEPLGAPGSRALGTLREASWATLLIVAYVGGVLLLLAKLAVEHALIQRVRRTSAPNDDPALAKLLASLSTRLGIPRRITLLRTNRATSPLTWGIVRPHVLIPSASKDWPTERQQAVLLHELAHVARHDCLTQTLAAIACAVYWPHPGVWRAAARLRVERELACDDRVINAGIPALDYADHLLAIAYSVQATRPDAALAVGMAASSHLETRLRAAIDSTRRRSTPGRQATLASAAIASVALVPLAALGARTAAAPTPTLAPALALAPNAAPARERPDATPIRATSNVTQQSFGGRWDIRLAEPAEAGLAPTAGPVIHVSMFTPGLNTFYIPLAKLDGLTAAQIAGSESSIRFGLRRDPGTFTFEGSFRQARGSGEFTFAPDSAFATELVRRGMQAPMPEQQFSLARHGMGLDFLDELSAQGYARPTTAAFVRAGSVGPELDELRTLAALGYKLGTLDAAMRLHSSGVTPEEIRAFADLGYSGLSADELIRAHNQSLSPALAREMSAKAGRRLSFSELIAARRREASTSSTTSAPPAPAGAAVESTTPLAGDWIITNLGGRRLQLDIDWDGNNQWRRLIGEADLVDLTLNVVGAPATTDARFRLEQDAGVFRFEGTFLAGRGRGRFRFEPNRAFGSTLRSLGVQNTEELTDHNLKNMAFYGMSAAVVREVIALGITPLTLHDVVDMAIREVTPDFVRAVRAAEVTDAATAQGIVELRFSGVSPSYVTELATLGYKRLSRDQIVDLYRAGVTPAFIRSLQREGHRNATPEALIELRRQR